jgi:hypothetical protein
MPDSPRNPLTLLLLSVALFTFLIQSGEMGTSDTDHRLQVAHSWWTGELQVAPEEYPDFGLHGRGGKLYAWYGIGQSLILFPFDVAGSAIEKLPVFDNYSQSGASPTIRTIFVSFSLNIFMNVLTAYFAFRLLILMRFHPRAAVLGTLALLCATTHLYYAENMQENNYIFLLTLIGIDCHVRWALSFSRDESASGSQRVLACGAAALGLNLLTRLTTGLDLLCTSAMAALILLQSTTAARRDKPATLFRALRTYVIIGGPIYAVFFFLDRLYQYVRFGSWTNTYVSIFAQDQRRLNPTLPPTFPFNGHWFQGGLSSGILGPLFSPSKSIFLFDPLLLLLILLLVVLWLRLTPVHRAFSIASLALLAAYILFYARYFWWAGDFSWGDRYVSSAVELACLLAVPLLLKHWRDLPSPLRISGALLAFASFALQLISIAYWLPLEIYQAMAANSHGAAPYPWIQDMRVQNILAGFAVQFGAPRPAWAPPIPQIDDAWDLLHITTWNFLPSLLRHTGEAPLWVVFALEGLWSAVAILLAFVLLRLFRAMPRESA